MKMVGYVRRSDATPKAAAVMRTESPKNTPAAARYPARLPYFAEVDNTYSELGPGNNTIAIVPST